MTVFVEIHALQTVPPSCVNRDDTGTPKLAVYGGVQRARVSSQSWKRAVRRYFDEHGTAETGKLTKALPRLVADRIIELDAGRADVAMDQAAAAIKAAGLQIEKPKKAKKDEEENAPADPLLAALIMVSRAQVDALARAVIATKDGKVTKKDAHAALDTNHSVDLALFGRMVANSKGLNVDGATQFAHAIGVSAAEVEFDFYTAVDDVKASRDDTDAGGGMMGTKEFTEATLYRYAALSVDELTESLAGDANVALEGVVAFVEAFVKSMPTGSIRSYGNRTLPDTVVVTVRENQPFNAASAFRTPVSPHEGDIIDVATERLAAKIDGYERKFDLPAQARWQVTQDGDTSLTEVLDGLREELA